MNNREKLLAGAKQCLREKGYSRTTARDIVGAAGTSLAAIGYHFGTIEALMNAALQEAVEELGREFGRNLADVDPSAEHQRRFEEIIAGVIKSVSDNRALWTAQFEMFAQAEHVEGLRDPLTASMVKGRYGLVELFFRLDPNADERKAWLLGSLCQSLVVGTVIQWMLDPDRALSGGDLVEALRLLMTELDGP